MNQQLNKNGKKPNKRVIKDSSDLSDDESIHHMEADNLNFCTFHGGRSDQKNFDQEMSEKLQKLGVQTNSNQNMQEAWQIPVVSNKLDKKDLIYVIWQLHNKLERTKRPEYSNSAPQP